jgi:hypothetical protein
MNHSEATKFINGQPVFGANKLSNFRKELIVKKEDTPENRERRLEMYRQRAELNLELFVV